MDESETNHPAPANRKDQSVLTSAPPSIAVNAPAYHPGNLVLHLGEIVKVVNLLSPTMASVSGGGGGEPYLVALTELSPID